MTHKPLVLIIDDDEGVLESLDRCLVDCDIKTHKTTDPSEALDLVRTADVSLVIADYRMPVMSGIQFLEQVKETSPFTVRIMLTGHGDVNAATEAINKAGVTSFLRKPWDDSELVATVKQSLYRYELELERRKLQHQLYIQNNWLRGFHVEMLDSLSNLEAQALKLERMLSQLKERLATLRTNLQTSVGDTAAN